MNLHHSMVLCGSPRHSPRLDRLTPGTVYLLVSNDFASVRAVFFDLDDTLCAYWNACRAGLVRTFERVPLDGKTPQELVGVWAAAYREFCPKIEDLGWYPKYLKDGGSTRTETMRRLLLRLGIDDPSLAKRLGKTYGEERLRALELFPGSLRTLESLHPRFPLGLITNGPADVQRHEIAKLGIGRFFQHVFIEGEVGEGKPMQSVFYRAAAAVDLPPAEILFVGNSYHHDIEPAILSGWKTIWVRRASDVPPSTEGVHASPEERSPDEPQPTAEVCEIDEVLSRLD